jgi:hypothetical protein
MGGSVMREGAVLERRSDGVEFKVISVGHWSSICSESGETDSVKWFGMDGERAAYVSASKGFTYSLV